MKISHDTPDLLVLDDIPWIIGGMMIAFILAFLGGGMTQLLEGKAQGLLLILIGGGMGAFAFLGFVRRTQVTLNRSTQLVRLRTRTLLGYTEKIFDLPDVSRARLQVHYNDGTKMYRLAIEVTNGPDTGVHPVSPVYTSGSGPRRAEETINLWLKNARE